jgi:rhamnulokinase
MMQAKWAGVVATIDEMRAMIRSSLDDSNRYEPQQKELWAEAYEKYLSVYKEM